MLHELLRIYLEEVETCIGLLQSAYVERYQEEMLTPSRVNLRIPVRFFDGRLLELNESMLVENEALRHLSYRYHFQDRDNHILFRYDNTPTSPTLIVFPTTNISRVKCGLAKSRQSFK